MSEIIEGLKEKQNKKFAKQLTDDWRAAAMSKTTEEVFKEISGHAMAVVQLTMEQEVDEDLKSLKEAVTTASTRYKEGKKLNLTSIEFLAEVLASRGVDIPSLSDLLSESQSRRQAAE